MVDVLDVYEAPVIDRVQFSDSLVQFYTLDILYLRFSCHAAAQVSPLQVTIILPTGS